jgi:hypothetical protein
VGGILQQHRCYCRNGTDQHFGRTYRTNRGKASIFDENTIQEAKEKMKKVHITYGQKTILKYFLD